MLEVCVEDVAGIAAAVRGGADRLELCSALAVGGLTPPVSLVMAAAAAPIPVHMLARPSVGGFAYAAADQALIAEDIRTAAEAGLAGVAIGLHRPDRRLDIDLLAKLVTHARDLETARGRPFSLTLHRAFDLCPDLPDALDAAIALGFDRVLTSGGQPQAIEVRAMLEQLCRRAAGIVIVAASGITPETLPAILRTGVREVHASCRQPVAADDDERRFGFAPDPHAATDATTVSRLAGILRGRVLV
jgi:copper homeostasis protein